MEDYEVLVASIEAFLAGSREEDLGPFGLSMQDRENLLPYIGILCDGESA